MEKKRTQEQLNGGAGEFRQHSDRETEWAERPNWSQSFYETLARTAPMGVFQTDINGDLIYVNERWCEIAGMSRNEAGGMGWLKKLHPEDMGKVRDAWYQCVENNIPFKLEYRFQSNAGLVSWVLGQAAAVREKSGQVIGYVGTITDITAAKENEKALHQYRDRLQDLVKERTAKFSEINQYLFKEITERNRMESALRQSEARYRAIVEDQTELICRFLPGGIITFVNDAYCRYFGKRREELIGHTFMPFIPEEDRERVEKHFDALSPLNPVATHEHRVATPAGDIRWQQWTNRVILDDHNRPVEFQAVGRDITDRKLMEQELKKTAEKIKLFAYSVAHDLKSPANALQGLTRLFHRRYGNVFDEKAKEYSNQILRAAEQIDALAQKINVYVSTKETSLRIEEISLSDVCKLIHAEFSHQLRNRQINWIEPANCQSISADKLSVVRALRNLVDNALKYGGPGLSEITIGYEKSENFHLLSVKDNGIGVEKEDAERIFGLFQRLKADQTVAGAGLGLAIVKEIAELHSGKVWVESGPGRGVKFYLAISKHLEVVGVPSGEDA